MLLFGDDGSVADPAEWHEEPQHVAFVVVPFWHGGAMEVEDPEGIEGVEYMGGLDEDEDMEGTAGVEDTEGIEGVECTEGTEGTECPEGQEGCVLS